MHSIRYSVKLQKYDLSLLRIRYNLLEVFHCPIRIRVAGGRNQKRVVLRHIECWTYLDRSIRYLRLHTPSSQFVSMETELLDTLRSKVVPRPCKAYRLGNANP